MFHPIGRSLEHRVRTFPRCYNRNQTAMPNQAPPETISITLSPIEGQQLFAFLTEVVESGAPGTDFSELDELLDKVGDANAAALWLRENVNLELEGQEAARVREILDSISPEKSIASEVETILPGIQG